MTTFEEKQAEHLAHWIDGDRNNLPHDDVAVAIWALRPDLAPKPRVSIEEVLSLVRSGPFLSDDNVIHEEDSNDDFVSSVFAQMDADSTNNVSLEDVLSRVQTGPFASLKDQGLEQSPDTNMFHTVLGDNSNTSVSANNNHWWTAPWLAGGIATALVFFVLFPSGFESPISEESIFAPKPQLERPRSVEEADVVSQKQRSRSSSRSSSSPMVAAGNVELSNDNIQPAKQVMEGSLSQGTLKDKGDSSRSMQLDDNSEQVIKAIQPRKQFLLDGTIDSVQLQSESASIASPVSRSSVVEGVLKQNENDKEAPISMNDNADEEQADIQVTSEELMSSVLDRDLEAPIEEESEELKEMKNEEAQEDFEVDELVTKEFESSEIPAVTEAVDVEVTSKESSVSNRVRSKRKGALLRVKKSASQPSSSASEMVVEMKETNTSTQQMDAVVPLPFVLSSEQQNAIQTLRTPEEVLALCDASKPRESLEVLWLGSSNFSTTVAIELLQISGEYDHGDPQYLKRNWLTLAALLRESGDITLARYYEQLASVLP